jgi:WXG100 protein secretion system (Wss), protein YukD
MPNNRIRITFSTTAGDLEEDFPVNQPLMALKREVMARLKLDPSQAEQFVVVLNGNPLDEAKTLGELGIAAGSVLTIERREVVKI